MSQLGAKLDSGKPRWSLFPRGSLMAVLRVLEAGAKKYAPDNWQHVPDARRRYYDAALRHLESWWAGEQLDPETGEHHLAHLVCCALFLIWFDAKDGPAESRGAMLATAREFALKVPIEGLEAAIDRAKALVNDSVARDEGKGAAYWALKHLMLCRRLAGVPLDGK